MHVAHSNIQKMPLNKPSTLVTSVREVNCATVVIDAVSVDWSVIMATFVVTSADAGVPSVTVVAWSGNYTHRVS